MPQKAKYSLKLLEKDHAKIGEHIAHIRKLKGMTQQELSQKMGISQILISNYETNRLHLNDSLIICFAKALGVTSDEILGLKPLKEETEKINVNIIKRLHKLKRLPASQQKSILQTMDLAIEAAENQLRKTKG